MNNKNHKTLLKCDKENSKNILFIKQISSIIKENEKKYPKIVYFAIIEFIHINNYQKISQELIIEYFKKKYESDPYGFIGTSTSKNFASEKMLIINVKKTLKYNNSFIYIESNNKLLVSLNFKNTYNNLIKLYNPIPQNGSDITLSIRNIMINDSHINDNINSNNKHKNEEKINDNNNPKKEQKDKRTIKTRKTFLNKKILSNGTNENKRSIGIKKEKDDKDENENEKKTEENNVKIKKEKEESENEDENRKMNKKHNSVEICCNRINIINNPHTNNDYFNENILFNNKEFYNYNIINDEINNINKYFFQLSQIKLKLDYFQKNYSLLLNKKTQYFEEQKKIKELEKEQFIIYKLIIYKYQGLKSFLKNQFFAKSLLDKQINDIEKNIADFEKNNDQINDKIQFLNNTGNELFRIKRKINKGLEDIYNDIKSSNLIQLFQDNLLKNNLIKNCIRDIEEIDNNNIILFGFNKNIIILQNKLENIKLKLQNLLHYDK